MAIDYLSYSAWKDWYMCPFRHKLIRIDGIRPFNGNVFSCFGKAVHSSAETTLLIEKEKEVFGGHLKDEYLGFNDIEHFNKKFTEEIASLDLSLLSDKDKELLTEEKIQEFRKQGEMLVPLVVPALKEAFGNFKVISAEHELRQTIDGFPAYDFYGFIDLIIQTEDGKYHIIDHKTCSWGWDLAKKTSIETTYQLTYYKYFFCKEKKIKHDDVETHFCLLKRTASKDNVEIYKVTSGEKKITNALNILNNCVINISRKNYVKNRLNCSKCEFHRTIHCH